METPRPLGLLAPPLPDQPGGETRGGCGAPAQAGPWAPPCLPSQVPARPFQVGEWEEAGCGLGEPAELQDGPFSPHTNPRPEGPRLLPTRPPPPPRVQHSTAQHTGAGTAEPCVLSTLGGSSSSCHASGTDGRLRRCDAGLALVTAVHRTVPRACRSPLSGGQKSYVKPGSRSCAVPGWILLCLLESSAGATTASLDASDWGSDTGFAGWEGVSGELWPGQSLPCTLPGVLAGRAPRAFQDREGEAEYMAEQWGGGGVACGLWAAGDALLGWAAHPPPRRCPWMPGSRMGGSRGRGGSVGAQQAPWGQSTAGRWHNPGLCLPDPFHCPPTSGVLPGFRWTQLPEPCLPIPGRPLPCAVGQALWSSASLPPRCSDPSRACEDALRPVTAAELSSSCELPQRWLACGEPGVPLPITRKPYKGWKMNPGQPRPKPGR